MSLPSSVKKIFATYGRRGGKVRARHLSAAQRRQSARRASLARWARVKAKKAVKTKRPPLGQ